MAAKKSDENGNGHYDRLPHPPTEKFKPSLCSAGLPIMGNLPQGAQFDPSKNVLDLVRAESKYQDGLREAQDKLTQVQIDDLHAMAELRASYDKRLDEAEAKRIDSVRAVDVAAVNVANQRAVEQASVLAAQVATSAEALRTLVATTAAAAQTTQQQLFNPLSSRITALEQAQYMGAGKAQLADPALADLSIAVKKLMESGYMFSGERKGGHAVWALIGAVLVAGASIVGTLIMLISHVGA